MNEIWTMGRKGVANGLGPGPKSLIAGDETDGYYGMFSESEFFSAESLAAALGLTEGTPITGALTWFKFVHKGKIKYIPKTQLRYSCSWAAIYRAGAMYPAADGTGAFPPPSGAVAQNKVVTYDGYQFDVHAMNALLTPTSTPSDTPQVGTEFRDLLLRVSAAWPGSTVNRWEAFDSPALGMTSTYTYGWLRDTNSSPGTGVSKLCHSGVANGIGGYANYDDIRNIIGWRPVLELLV